MNDFKPVPPPFGERSEAIHPIGVLWHIHPDLLCTMDSDGHLVTANPAWQATLGWTDDDLKATTAWELIHPEDVDRTRQEAAGIFDGQPSVRFVNRWRHKDGSYRWISWVAIMEGDLLFCTGRDMTEDKEKEAALAARTAERDQLWKLSQDMFARANLEGMMSAVSPGWTRILGWSEGELLSRPYATFMHPEDMGPTLEALAEMGATGQPTRFENRISTSEGGWKWIEWTVAPEMEGLNFIAVGRDLSEVKTREAELTAAQESLRQSQKMEAVGQLTGGLAHDFNNLIAGISGSLEMMGTRLAQNRISEIERYIAAASGAARRAAGLTQRLLAFSRRQTLTPQVTDINRLVAGMLELIHRSVGPEISVEVETDAGLWNVFVDASQLENALLNLCINARDAMPDGGRITIETANVRMDGEAAKDHGVDAGDYVSLAVRDTGTGMAPDVISRAFDPFFTTKPLGQGTGLGLSMVYGFAGQSGGAVRIASELGEGTRIAIHLPRHRGQEEIDEERAARDDSLRSQGGQTVLVVDDEPLIRMIAMEALEELGYTVIEAEDAPSAMKIISSDRHLSLLVTDVGLPNGMNGRQLADAARSVRKDLPVMFITGYAENAVLNKGHLEPGMRVITKPFQIDAFAQLAKQLTTGG